MNTTLPKITAKIFEYLQKGLLISSNSMDEEVRKMYFAIEEHYEDMYEYFSQINYCLERGNEYFHFSRTEPKATLEQKVTKAYYWIDVLDFFKTYDEAFGVGTRFRQEAILMEVGINVVLQNKVDGMKKHFSGKGMRREILQSMLERLKRESFIELENPDTNTYKVMTAWNYLEQLVASIQITEETEDEKPE